MPVYHSWLQGEWYSLELTVNLQRYRLTGNITFWWAQRVSGKTFTRNSQIICKMYSWITFDILILWQKMIETRDSFPLKWSITLYKRVWTKKNCVFLLLTLSIFPMPIELDKCHRFNCLWTWWTKNEERIYYRRFNKKRDLDGLVDR